MRLRRLYQPRPHAKWDNGHKLTPAQRHEVVRRVLRGEKQKALAFTLGVTVSYIYLLLKRKPYA